MNIAEARHFGGRARGKGSAAGVLPGEPQALDAKRGIEFIWLELLKHLLQATGGVDHKAHIRFGQIQCARTTTNITAIANAR